LPAPSPDPAPLDELVARALARGPRGARRPGLVVGALRTGERAVAGRGLPADAILEIGSITKVVTALALADMALEGLVALDDPLSAHLPAAARIRRRGDREITLADLAAHASGLPRLPPGALRRALRERDNPYRSTSRATLDASLARIRPRRAPGRRARYSNLGAALLGNALAHRAGTDYESLVRARVLGPLGMDDTWVHPPDHLRDRVVGGHTRRGRPTPRWDLPAYAGAGALSSSAADLLRLAAAVVRPPDSRLGQAIRLSTAPRARMAGPLEVGLGWMRSPLRRTGHTVLGHSGGTGGFRSVLAIAPQAGAAAVVLSDWARSVERSGLWILERLVSGA
jgi:CubicO group peptidase (beta-lactamase class C family)